jgi:hypothetical protein
MKEPRNVKPFPRRKDRDEELDGLSAFALSSAEAPSDFVSRVMRGLPAHSGRQRTSLDSWKWAAALLIFSAALGYGFSIAEETADSVASLTSAPADSDSAILSSL